MNTDAHGQTEPLLESIRVILYHKHPTSARTLFLRHADGAVCLPKPLPALSTVLEEESPPSGAAVHPASLAQTLCRHLGFPPDAIEVNAEFSAQVDTPGQMLPVYLARFKSMDPPREAFARKEARFCALTELRDCVPAELELLRLAYQVVLGG